MEMKDFFFYSAPTSPRSSSSSSPFHHHSSLFDYDDDDDIAVLDGVPLLSHQHHGPLLSSCETTTCDEDGLPQKQVGKDQVNKDDFEFDFSGQLNLMTKPSLSSADELFDGGIIRPLKLKEKLETKSRQKGSEDQHPFEAAFDCSNRCRNSNDGANEFRDRGRGRGRTTANANANADTSNTRGGSSGRRGISRSLSPLRVSEFALLQQQHQHLANSSSRSSCSRKWRLKDLFLFRSASEGHYKDTQSFSKRWSFRSSAMVSGSGSGSESKRRGQVQAAASAHEMHYTTKRAVSEEMKKKTSLPYKHGLLSCLGFSPILPQFSYNFPSSAPTLS